MSGLSGSPIILYAKTCCAYTCCVVLTHAVLCLHMLCCAYTCCFVVLTLHMLCYLFTYKEQNTTFVCEPKVFILIGEARKEMFCLRLTKIHFNVYDNIFNFWI